MALTKINNGDSGLIARNKINAIVDEINRTIEESGITTGTTFVCANPIVSVVNLFKNGVRLTNIYDYSFTGSTITFINTLDNDLIVAITKY